MTNPEVESNSQPLRLDIDRRLKLEFHGSKVTSAAIYRNQNVLGQWPILASSSKIRASQIATAMLSVTRNGTTVIAAYMLYFAPESEPHDFK